MRSFVYRGMVVVSMALMCGCVSLPGKKDGSDAAPPPPYMTQAVMSTFKAIFDGVWTGVKIHIKPSAYVPNDIKRVGKNEAEELTIEELRKRYLYTEEAPAMAVVDAYKDKARLIHVEVEYFPLKIKNWHKPVIGRGFYHYVYKRKADKLVLLSSTEMKYN